MGKQQGFDLGLELRPGEEVEFSQARWFWPLWFIGVFSVLTFGFGLLLLPFWFVFRRTRLTITNQRVIAVSGLIIRNQQVFERYRVQNLAVRQGPLASLLGYGDVLVETAGNTSTVRIKGISRVRDARTAADKPTPETLGGRYIS